MDTFEGGKGSRASFLNRVATEFEKKKEGVICMVSSKTIEGLKASLQEKDFPDMLSFGVGAGFAFDYCIGDVTPWYRGAYAIYSKTDDFSALSANNCVLSKGGENLPLVAAAMHALSGEFVVEDATTAYVRFLNGDYKYLLGTQRDACRFSSRGVSVYCQPISAFSDLFGYIGVTDEKNAILCEEFIGHLTSQEKQKELDRLGLFSPKFTVYGGGEGVLSALEETKAAYTSHLFASAEELAGLERCAREVLNGGNVKELKKFLKSL